MPSTVRPADVRPRATSLEQLREEARRYRSTFECAPVAMAQVGLAGEWLEVNDRLCGFLGRSRRELLQTRFQDQTHPDDMALDLGHMVRLIGGEIDEYAIEKRYLRADGAVVWGRLHASLVRGPSPDGVTPGTPAFGIAMIEDITERRATFAGDTSGADEDAAVRRVLDASPDCVETLGLDGRRLSINAAGLRLLEAEGAAEAVGTDWIAAWSESATSTDAREAVREAAAGRTMRFTASRRTWRGASRWWDVVVAPLTAADGRTSRLIATARDVTASQAATAALRETAAAAEGRATVMSLVAGERPLAEVLTEVARLLERLVPGGRAAVQLVDQGTGTLGLAAAPSLPGALAALLEREPIAPDGGAGGAAAFAGAPVVVRDVDGDPRRRHWPAAAEAHGLHACWAQPCRHPSGQVIATVALFVPGPRGPRPEEERALALAAQLTADAVVRLQAAESARDAARSLVRQNGALGRSRADLLARSRQLIEANEQLRERTAALARAVAQRERLAADSGREVRWAAAAGSGAATAGGEAEQRRLLEQLHQSDARLAEVGGQLQAILQGSATALALLAPDGAIVAMNASAARLAGMATPAAGLLAWDVPALAEMPRHRDTLRDAFTRAAADESVQLSVGDRDADTCALQLHLAPVRDEEGVLRYVVVEGRDVTAPRRRRRRERARRVAAEQARDAARAAVGALEAALATSSDARWELQPATGRLRLRGPWLDGLGYGLATPTHASAWLALVHPDDQDEIAFQVEACQDGRLDTVSCEVRVRTAAGLWRWAEVRGRQLLAGAPGALAGTITDVTDRLARENERHGLLREAERNRAELEVANERLRTQALTLAQHAEWLRDETRARDRARLLAEAALAEAEAARREAQEANRAKSDFLATMSHELRTPLNAIAGYVELIELGIYGAVTEKQREALGSVRRSQRYLLALISDVLSFAKIESGRIDLRVVRTDVRDAAERALELVAVQARQRGIHLELAPPAAGAACLADDERLQQILLNLLTNAVKFSGATADADDAHRRGHVRVECGRAGAMVRFVVRDDGRGIPPERLSTVFDPFVQVDRHLTDTAQRGVGLGLAISRDLARAMGGDLTVESAVGAGSAFTLTLPAADA